MNGIFRPSVFLSVCPSVCPSHLFTRGQFWPSGIVVACLCVSVCPCIRACVYQSRACPYDYSQLVQARITKFGTTVQKTLVKVSIFFGDDRSWPSRSNLTWKSNFISFWHYGNQSQGYFNGGRPPWPPAVPRLAARPSQSNPRGSGPEVLKRERGHVTVETWSFCGGGLQGPPA